MRAVVLAVVCGVLVLAGCGGGSSTPSGPAPVLPPTANAGGPYTGTVGTPVTFTGAGSSDPQGEALTYAWNFGDGTAGTGVSPTHTYSQVAGVSSMVYTVSLTVQNSYGESSTPATTKATIQGAAPLADAGLTGTVSTGATAIVGAHVYLFAANTTGNAGAGIAASSSNASISLLSATETATSDTVGAYVLTDTNGNFTMSGDYTCTSGQQLYIYASGGSAGSLTNTAGTLMAAIGSCPATSNSVVAKVNEVSTVVAAYALEGFATDPLHVSSSGSALALVGIANAFANAANLETLATGVALATTPAGNGTAPQTTVDSLANLLSVCVNPGNYSATSCTTLFAAALSGGLTGTTPKDTATAAIYVAQNAGANTGDIYNVTMSSPPYSPVLGRVPNDWTMSIVYTGGGLSNPLGIAIDGAGNAWMANSIATGTVTELSSKGAVGTSGYAATGLSLPMSIAVDPTGNVWTANSTGNSITEFSPTGSVLTGGYSGGGLQNSVGVAIDGTGNLWVENAGNASVAKITNAGALVSTYNTFAPDGDDSIAIDGSGNVWLAANGNSVTKLSNAGTTLSGSGYTNASLNGPTGIAIDSAGDAWITNGAGNSVTEFNNSGTAITGPGGLISATFATPFAIAIDGAGSAFVLNRPKFNTGVAVVEISTAGAIVSGSNGFVGGSMNSPFGIAVDGSGDVWITSSASNAVTEFIGVAAPVVTPLSVGVKNNTLGKRP